MLISASRRTDIPAFFGKYFFENLIRGSFIIENPFNKKRSLITFNQSDIEGIIFWTKNPEKFFPFLKKIKSMNIPFYFQFTINNYPDYIEPNIPCLKKRIDIFYELYDIIKPFPIIWRYDPIILTEKFNEQFHLENFQMILENINGGIKHTTVSVLTLYKKIKKFFPDISTNITKIESLIKKMYNLSNNYNIPLDTCCIKIDNIPLSKCVNGQLLNKNYISKKHYGQRKLCNCDKSIDIGYYRTCKHKCLYCYAN